MNWNWPSHYSHALMIDEIIARQSLQWILQFKATEEEGCQRNALLQKRSGGRNVVSRLDVMLEEDRGNSTSGW